MLRTFDGLSMQDSYKMDLVAGGLQALVTTHGSADRHSSDCDDSSLKPRKKDWLQCINRLESDPSTGAQSHCLMKRRNRQLDSNESDAINVSPLIDVVFILLIFFIVSATFVTAGIRSHDHRQLPEKLSKNAVIFALSGKTIKYAGSTVQLEEIPSLVEQASKDRENQWSFRWINGLMRPFSPKSLLKPVKNRARYPLPPVNPEYEKISTGS